ncbi:MAG: glycosyltransferase family 2 protein [Psychroflexus sp.]
MPKISALLITLNEEDNIASVIENLHFADEIVIVDSFSKDRTIEIAQNYPNVKIYQHKFEDFTKQRNYALSKAKFEWVLFLDADERVTKKLKKEILETVNSKNPADAYFFYRKFMFKNKTLHFSGWQTDKNIRLFKKSKAKYTEERLVHEVLSVNGSQGKLKNKLIHYSYQNYHSYKRKMLSYAKLKAKELYNKKVEPNPYHYYVKPLYKFIHGYIIRLGFLDGRKGLTICYLNALSVYKRYPFLDEMIKNSKKGF